MKVSPLKLFAGLLTAYAAVTFLIKYSEAVLSHALVIYITAAIVFLVWRSVAGKKVLPYNTLISANIIFLTLHPSLIGTPSIVAAIIAFLCIGTVFDVKFIFRKGMVVNPAVGALFVVAVLALFIPYINEMTVSWWGTSYNGGLSILLMAPAVFVAVKYFRKYWVFGAYIISYVALTALIKGFDTLQFTLLDGTMYFLAGIMLIEPKTSPVKPKEQITFGILAAILIFFLQKSSIPLPGEILGILLMNLAYFFYKSPAVSYGTIKKR